MFITLTYEETIELFLKGTIPIPNCNNIEDICNNIIMMMCNAIYIIFYKISN